MKTLVAALAALALSFGSAHAQQGAQHQHGQDAQAAAGQEMEHQGAMMAMDRPSPSKLLAVAEMLGLDEAQVARLEAVDSAFHADHHEPMHAAMDADAKAQAALDAAAPDLNAYRAALEEAAGHRVEARVVDARARVDAMAVLTPAQKETLHHSLHLAHTLGGGHGMGGSGGGMGGGMGHGSGGGIGPGAGGSMGGMGGGMGPGAGGMGHGAGR